MNSHNDTKTRRFLLYMTLASTRDDDDCATRGVPESVLLEQYQGSSDDAKNLKTDLETLSTMGFPVEIVDGGAGVKYYRFAETSSIYFTHPQVAMINYLFASIGVKGVLGNLALQTRPAVSGLASADEAQMPLATRERYILSAIPAADLETCLFHLLPAFLAGATVAFTYKGTEREGRIVRFQRYRSSLYAHIAVTGGAQDSQDSVDTPDTPEIRVFIPRKMANIRVVDGGEEEVDGAAAAGALADGAAEDAATLADAGTVTEVGQMRNVILENPSEVTLRLLRDYTGEPIGDGSWKFPVLERSDLARVLALQPGLRGTSDPLYGNLFCERSETYERLCADADLDGVLELNHPGFKAQNLGRVNAKRDLPLPHVAIAQFLENYPGNKASAAVIADALGLDATQVLERACEMYSFEGNESSTESLAGAALVSFEDETFIEENESPEKFKAFIHSDAAKDVCIQLSLEWLDAMPEDASAAPSDMIDAARGGNLAPVKLQMNSSQCAFLLLCLNDVITIYGSRDFRDIYTTLVEALAGENPRWRGVFPLPTYLSYEHRDSSATLITKAIRTNAVLEVTYTSPRSGTTAQRVIYPQALIGTTVVARRRSKVNGNYRWVKRVYSLDGLDEIRTVDLEPPAKVSYQQPNISGENVALAASANAHWLGHEVANFATYQRVSSGGDEIVYVFPVTSRQWLAGLVLDLGSSFYGLAPADVRNEVAEIVGGALDPAGDPAPAPDGLQSDASQPADRQPADRQPDSHDDQ